MILSGNAGTHLLIPPLGKLPTPIGGPNLYRTPCCSGTGQQLLQRPPTPSTQFSQMPINRCQKCWPWLRDPRLHNNPTILAVHPASIKYRGVWAPGACGVYKYAVKISSLGKRLKCCQKARGLLCFYVFPSAGRPGSWRGPLGTQCRCESQTASWHSGWECDSACLGDDARAAGDTGPPQRGRVTGVASSYMSSELRRMESGLGEWL